jgi:hypothetical protein
VTRSASSETHEAKNRRSSGSWCLSATLKADATVDQKNTATKA